nr:MAG TPA: hypothetical protein [Caudoviricetes sp.]
MDRPKASLTYAAFATYRLKSGTVFSPQGPIRITGIFQKYRLPSGKTKARAEKRRLKNIYKSMENRLTNTRPCIIL